MITSVKKEIPAETVAKQNSDSEINNDEGMTEGMTDRESSLTRKSSSSLFLSSSSSSLVNSDSDSELESDKSESTKESEEAPLFSSEDPIPHEKIESFIKTLIGDDGVSKIVKAIQALNQNGSILIERMIIASLDPFEHEQEQEELVETLAKWNAVLAVLKEQKSSFEINVINALGDARQLYIDPKIFDENTNLNSGDEYNQRKLSTASDATTVNWSKPFNGKNNDLKFEEFIPKTTPSNANLKLSPWNSQFSEFYTEIIKSLNLGNQCVQSLSDAIDHFAKKAIEKAGKRMFMACNNQTQGYQKETYLTCLNELAPVRYKIGQIVLASILNYQEKPEKIDDVIGAWINILENLIQNNNYFAAESIYNQLSPNSLLDYSLFRHTENTYLSLANRQRLETAKLALEQKYENSFAIASKNNIFDVMARACQTINSTKSDQKIKDSSMSCLKKHVDNLKKYYDGITQGGTKDTEIKIETFFCKYELCLVSELETNSPQPVGKLCFTVEKNSGTQKEKILYKTSQQENFSEFQCKNKKLYNSLKTAIQDDALLTLEVEDKENILEIISKEISVNFYNLDEEKKYSQTAVENIRNRFFHSLLFEYAEKNNIPDSIIIDLIPQLNQCMKEKSDPHVLENKLKEKFPDINFSREEILKIHRNYKQFYYHRLIKNTVLGNLVKDTYLKSENTLIMTTESRLLELQNAIKQPGMTKLKYDGLLKKLGIQLSPSDLNNVLEEEYRIHGIKLLTPKEEHWLEVFEVVYQVLHDLTPSLGLKTNFVSTLKHLSVNQRYHAIIAHIQECKRAGKKHARSVDVEELTNNFIAHQNGELATFTEFSLHQKIAEKAVPEDLVGTETCESLRQKTEQYLSNFDLLLDQKIPNALEAKIEAIKNAYITIKKREWKPDFLQTNFLEQLECMTPKQQRCAIEQHISKYPDSRLARAKNLVDSKEKAIVSLETQTYQAHIELFKTIHRSMQYASSGFTSQKFMQSIEDLSIEQQYKAIEEHSKLSLTSRTKYAWELTKKYLDNLNQQDDQQDDLLSQILKIVHLENKQSKPSFFNSFNQSKIKKIEDEINRYFDNYFDKESVARTPRFVN